MATVYWDNSSKGVNKYGRTAYHRCWRAEYTHNGKRCRKRFRCKHEAISWLEENKQNTKHIKKDVL